MKSGPMTFQQELFVDEPAERNAKEVIKKLNLKKPFCIVHLDATSLNRSMSMKEKNDLVDAIKETGVDVLIINSNFERKDVKKFESKSVLLTAALMDSCSFFVGVNSGPAHIAEARGKKIIVAGKGLFKLEDQYIVKKDSLILTRYNLKKIKSYLKENYGHLKSL